MKFTIYNYAGQEHSYYKVESETIPASTTSVIGNATAHLILVVDRSGSMWGSMGDVKKSIEEVLTSEETKKKNLLVSLVSYSSVGDTTIHFSRSPIADIAKKNSSQTQAIRALRPTGLTCISGGLETALGLVKKNETTMVSLHSDGYANDDSSYTEQQNITKLIQATNNSNLSIHTIAHTSWSDFQTLSRIANSLSGTCVYARSSNDVQGPLNDVLDNASGPVEPPFIVEKNKADLVVFFSQNGRRVFSSTVDLMVSGLPVGSDKTAYRFTKITKKNYKKLKTDVCGESGDKNALPLYLFSKGMLAIGKINLAKYALISTRDRDLIDNHYQALVNEELAEMATDIDELVFDNAFDKRDYADSFGFDAMNTSVLEITTVLQKYATSFQVDIKKLRNVYVRRTIDKIPGKRDDDGSIIHNKFETRPVENDDFVEIVECDINQNTANINLTISDPVQLYPVGKNKPVKKISDVDISELIEYRAFTIVGDGRLNLPSIHVKIADKMAFQALKKLDVVAGRHSATKSYEIDFQNRPMLPFLQDFANLGGVFDRLMSYRVLQSVIKALLKGSSTELTKDQIKELRQHYITPSLNVSLPSTVPYSDLDDAIASGEVERRPSYVIDIGTTSIQNKADFRSANQALKTFYTFTSSSKKPGKVPKWEYLLDKDVQLERKKLTKRTKVTPVDIFMMEIFDSLLGITSSKKIEDIIKGLGKSKLATNIQKFAQRKVTKSVLSGFEDLKDVLDEASSEDYVRTVCPIVFYIGGTGLIPDDFDGKAFDADALQKMHPHLKISKAEKSGTFFIFDDNIISVFIKDVLVSR